MRAVLALPEPEGDGKARTWLAYDQDPLFGPITEKTGRKAFADLSLRSDGSACGNTMGDRERNSVRLSLR